VLWFCSAAAKSDGFVGLTTCTPILNVGGAKKLVMWICRVFVKWFACRVRVRGCVMVRFSFSYWVRSGLGSG
jgi:hypothetical protein